MGISGNVAARFLRTEITPLLALVGLLLGVFAILITPREEEPQIDVTFANVFIPYPGATAKEVENLVTTSAEQVLSEIDGVKHIYSVSRPGSAILTVQFKVGEARDDAIIKLYNAIYSNQDWLPQGVGVGQPLIKPKGIDDVPIVALTLWTKDQTKGGFELQRVAHAVEAELKRVPGTRDIYTIGGADEVVKVTIDPARLSGYNIALDDLRQALQSANVAKFAGSIISDNRETPVKAGEFLSTPEQVDSLVIGMHNDKPVYLSDVAAVSDGPDTAEQYVFYGHGAAESKPHASTASFPAVTLAIAKKPGTNAVTIANEVIQRFQHIRGIFIPDGIEVSVTRNYGVTANDKARTLIGKLIFATSAVVLLVLFALGRREAFIVGTTIVITLAITLFASWAWGFTLNRVSLFALIFSIGILVDDAIVVVENIHRRTQIGNKPLHEMIPLAVDEVGGPTILATFTVIAALLPMAFVTGLMGPYMSPIPINASMGMLISLVVAFVVTPWLCLKVFSGNPPEAHHEDDAITRWLDRVFRARVQPFLRREQGGAARRRMFYVLLVLIMLSASLAGFKLVVLKMLPFDNKSEFQVVLDMPEGTPVENTARVLTELGNYLATISEVENYQAYAGTASPINFNGLVRQYYLREGHNVGDIQVNLVDKHHRKRSSHEIASGLRQPLQAIGQKYNANVKIVEVPPGPPVFSPLVAEVYGFNYEGQIDTAKRLRDVFAATPDIVDIDDSIESSAPQRILKVDRQKAALLGLTQQTVVDAVATLIGGENSSYLHVDSAKYAIPIKVEFSEAGKSRLDNLLAIKLRTSTGNYIPLADVVTIVETPREHSIYHKDLLPVVFVTGDMAGKLDSPLYGMFAINGKLDNPKTANGLSLEKYFINQPENPYKYSIKWDGEWQITYETFRDMGIAYSIGLIMIYLLVVAQFRSYLVPLIIMAPIPLTVIGIMPGHALLAKQFTATSMIGMIALAGIIVRNSILLVDFINQQVEAGQPFEEAVIRAGVVRAKPIILTALAAMLGAFFILDDPIFGGLAISLISGILVSTLLTLVVIPVMYYAYMYKKLS